MKSADLRRLFLDFYTANAHTEVPSGSLVPSSYDPSVLLTTAGMQPFKPYFLGQDTPPAPRLTSCQKCFRTPDIDEVGNTARHLTFFEMLGNFSFGDYFKDGAISLAWDLLINKIELDPSKLWVTVHEGDAQLGVGLDEEAVELWVAQGVARDRIVALGADNFWKAGPTGPCGPCSEIYFDRGEVWGCGKADCKPGCECDRYLEFYNLVFMQFDRDSDGVLSPLPKQNIDTGMGLERISAIVQDNVSVFEIDSYVQIMDWIAQQCGKHYGTDPQVTKAMRVLSDHGRGMTFLASDGVTPSNEGRGYVLRRIIRRAIAQADRIGMYDSGKTGVLAGLSEQVVHGFAGQYRELTDQRSTVLDLLNAEEERFLRTLDRGSGMLRDVISGVKQRGAKSVSGEDAFKLHDTYGFPVELTTELAAESGVGVDLDAFHKHMVEQRERARAAAGSTSLPIEDAAAFVRGTAETEFVGYDATAATTTVVGMRQLATEGETGQRMMLKVAKSPLYAEGGGQVSDRGLVRGSRGAAEVQHVMRFDNDQVIIAELVDGILEVGDDVEVIVDEEARRRTESNHTATHLLHKALRDRFGDSVRQAGSLVAPDRLRFDFACPQALDDADIAAIAKEVNRAVAAVQPVSWKIVDMDTARESGAMMLFGEKYGDAVRMVQVGDGWSVELCGGTHVTNTGSIQLFIILSESSVGANTRRIEALTGAPALEYLQQRAAIAEAAAAAAHVEPTDLAAAVDQLKRENRELERAVAAAKSGGVMDDAIETVETLDGGMRLVVFRTDELTGDELLDLSDRLKQKLEPVIVLVGGAHDGKVSLIANLSTSANEQGVQANTLISQIAGIVDGGGGGRPTMARAGGKDASRLDEALQAGRTAIVESLS